MSEFKDNPASCALPLQDYGRISVTHGGGGRLMQQLIQSVFLAHFGPVPAGELHDGAVVTVRNARLALTTDSYVVSPLFFPGGDIGSLAVNGTVNDLAMCGAQPLYLTAGFIIEEGLELELLKRVVSSMAAAAIAARVQIVTGDTKVVERSHGDGVFINTAGLGLLRTEAVIAPASVQAGDAVLLSSDVGRHGMAVLAQREGLEFETTIESDCAPVAAAVMALLDAGIRVHCLRDCTRGGLATAACEIASAAGRHIDLIESAIPVQEQVQGACEILGFDPLYVANEGCFIAFVDPADAEHALQILQQFEVSAAACQIGSVQSAGHGLLTLCNRFGGRRVLDMLSGEQLPRIC